MDGPVFLTGVMVGASGVGFLLLLLFIARPWFHALLSGVAVPFPVIVAMRLRGCPPVLVIDAYVALRKAGEDVRIDQVEATFLAYRGRVRSVPELVDAVRAEFSARSS